MKLSVCIPMYNEAYVIENTAKTLHAYLTNVFGDDFELIFSDDGSSDGSKEKVESLKLSGVRVVGTPENHGKGSAVRNAMLTAKGDYIMFTDADLAYGTDVIGQLVSVFEENPQAGVVIGSRTLTKDGYKNYTFLRRIASRCYLKLVLLIGRIRLSDYQCGCKGFTQQAAKDIFSKCRTDGFSFDLEALLYAKKLGYPIVEMSVSVLRHGDSKMHLFRDSFRMFRELIRIRNSVK